MKISGTILQASRQHGFRKSLKNSQNSLSRTIFSSFNIQDVINKRRKEEQCRFHRRTFGRHPLCSSMPMQPSVALSGLNVHTASTNTIQTRTMATWLPEVVQNFSIWGGSGFILKTLHADGVLPYWACFAAISMLVRTALLPLVIYGAQTSARFAKVVPEVQFLLSLFQNDMKKLRERKGSMAERAMLMRTNLGTLGGIYKLHKINPFSVFLSPLLQLPIFWYVSIDLRKIVNGLDPELAQQLVESSIAWVPDLTEPDPWYGLPIIAGLIMYWNVEVAVGRRSLSGPAAAKADTAVLLKDVFQSFAVFMPCFTSQLPGGIQVYIVTSFTWTLVQSAALRTEGFRKLVGLPSMLAPPPEARYAKEFVELKKLEQKAREIRGDGPLLGKGVLAQDLEVSFPGRYIKSSIQGSGIKPDGMPMPAAEKPVMKVDSTTESNGPFFHGISAPSWQLKEQKAFLEPSTSTDSSTDEREYMPQVSEEAIEKANRGEYPVPTQFVDPSKAKAETFKAPAKLSTKRFNKGKGKAGSKRRRR